MYSLKIHPDVNSFDEYLSIRKWDKFILIKLDEKEAEQVKELINL